MFNALAEVCNLFTPQECWNYFCEAGYGSGQRRDALEHLHFMLMHSLRL